MANQRAGILGTGHSYPEGILTNADLAKIVETSDDWITSRTGIKQRRKAAPGEYTSLFAVRAARQAIERARLDPAADCLIRGRRGRRRQRRTQERGRACGGAPPARFLHTQAP